MKLLSTRLLEFNWTSVFVARLVAQSVSLMTTFFAATILVAYVYNVDSVYRIFAFGPATNPLTAACLALLGLSIYLNICIILPLLQRALVYVVLILCLIRIMDGFLDTQIHTAFVPFQQLIAYEHLIGLSNWMGMNTAWMIFLTALALILLGLKKISVSFGLVICAVAIPMVSIFGYLLDLPAVYGEMAVTTASIGLLLITSLIVHMTVEHHARLGIASRQPDILYWSDTFSVGDQSLDQQHKRMLSLINRMVRKGNALKRKDALSLIKRMQEYTEEHLKYEEDLLQKIGYPYAESHHVIHQFYIKKVDFLLNQVQDDYSVELLHEATEFLKEWWTYHVLDEDMKYKPFIEALK